MNTKPFMFNFWVFVLMITTMLGVVGENVYQAYVIVQQQHTIRQYMGLEPGVDATPYAIAPVPEPKAEPPAGPEAPTPFTDQRRWQRAL